MTRSDAHVATASSSLPKPLPFLPEPLPFDLVPSSAPSTVEALMSGYTPLEEAVGALDLSAAQKLKLAAAHAAVRLYRRTVLPFRQSRWTDFLDSLEAVKNVTMDIPDYGLTPGPDNHYLSRPEVEQFSRDGVLAPFRVVSAEAAEALRTGLYDLLRDEPERPMYIGENTRQVLERHGPVGLNYWGMYRALDHKPLRDVLTSAPVTHRMASLLGPDVLCWRNQLFEKPPGAEGTIWHQASVFQEASKGQKLRPTEPTDAPRVQLTTWMALSDVTVENGAMRVLPGSFSDGSLERFYEYAASNQLDFIARLGPEFTLSALQAALFTTGQFVRSQIIVDAFARAFPEFFERAGFMDLTMKAGEAVIFSSLNLHGSYPNITGDQTRLACVGRYTATSTQVYPDMPVDHYPTPEGYMPFPTAPLRNILAHGEDRYGHNVLL